MKRIKLLIIAAYAVLLFALTGCQSPNNTVVKKEQSPELLQGDTAPQFTAQLSGGGTFSLDEQKGKIVLLNFWATWCGPCVGEMPAFERLQADYGDKLSVLAVNCMEETDTVDRFISDNGYTFPIAYDEDGTIGSMYPTKGIPYTLVIGADGVISNIYLGADEADVQYEEYKRAIAALLE